PVDSPESDAPRSLTTTLAPSAAKASECARPRPRPPPVTITTRPSQIPIIPPSRNVSEHGGDGLGVLVAVAEMGVEQRGALPEALRVDLPREPDATVHLDAGLAVHDRGVSRHGLGDGGRARRVVVTAPVERDCGGVDRGTRHFGAHEHV